MERSNSERKGPQSAEQMLIGSQDRTKPGHCQEHGSFVNRLIPSIGPVPEHWSGCLQCVVVKCRENEDARRQQDRDERRAEIVARCLERSGIPSRFQGKTFANYVAGNDGERTALRKVAQYADWISKPSHEGRSMMLTGRVGNGKTHLACAAIRQVIETTAVWRAE